MTHFLLQPIVIIVAGLALAVVILITALFLFRNSGKKKGAKAANAGGGGTPDWQRQGQQGAPGTWNQPGAGGPNDSWGQQQPGAWGAQSPAQQQQQPGAWGAQPPAQQQQPGAWGAQSPAAQQQQPGAWGAQPPAAQQQQPGDWGSPLASNAPPAGAGMGGSQPSWGADATFSPQKSTPAAQDQWGQPQGTPPQQGGAVWGTPISSPSQPQAPTAYGGNASGQSWAQPAPAQPAAWGQQPSQQPVSTPPPTANNAMPPWQQGTDQPPFGSPTPAAAGFGAPDAASLFADNDKTMLRPSGPQGSLGTVRVEEGKEPGRVYEVRKEELSIGRSRESDIFLEDLAVSRLHAKIVSLGNGNYALKDEGSANGTKVNGQLVNKYQTYPLQEGDRIQLGQTVLVFARR